MPRTSQQARLAILTRLRPPDDPELIEARRDFWANEIAEHIRKVLDQAPPMTDAQLSKITMILEAAPRGQAMSYKPRCTNSQLVAPVLGIVSGQPDLIGRDIVRRLRGQGITFSEASVYAALAGLVKDGRLTVRDGPGNSKQYRVAAAGGG
jgi:Transcriptional regulator PadR-like family